MVAQYSLEREKKLIHSEYTPLSKDKGEKEGGLKEPEKNTLLSCTEFWQGIILSKD